VLGQREVAVLRTVPVHNGGHTTFTADGASRPLAELGTRLGFDTDLRHGQSLLKRIHGMRTGV
jgi:hypothetical protein